jgi:hypothetical protein
MAMPIRDASDINTVLRWAMGQPGPSGAPITDDQATTAARNLAAKAYLALGAGLRPGQVTLTRPPARAPARGRR